jgi:hypothetical protein
METKLTVLLRRGMIAGAIAAALAVAGCGGSSTPPSSAAQAPATHAPATHAPASSTAGQQVTITGTNALRFMPMTVHVHAGKVRITLKDMGAYPHNIVIPRLGVSSPSVTGDPGGEQVSARQRQRARPGPRGCRLGPNGPARRDLWPQRPLTPQGKAERNETARE